MLRSSNYIKQHALKRYQDIGLWWIYARDRVRDQNMVIKGQGKRKLLLLYDPAMIAARYGELKSTIRHLRSLYSKRKTHNKFNEEFSPQQYKFKQVP